METESLELDPQQQAELAFATGQRAFERGLYREAVEALVAAVAVCDRNSKLGGDIQLWLVTAYQATGQRSEALALCRQLQTHAYLDIRKQSKRLLYILEAPKLASRPEWLTQIPDLEQVNDQAPSQRVVASSPPKPQEPKRFIPQEPVDLSQVDTADNGFMGVALLAISLLLISLIWLS